MGCWIDGRAVIGLLDGRASSHWVVGWTGEQSLGCWMDG